MDHGGLTHLVNPNEWSCPQPFIYLTIIFSDD